MSSGGYEVQESVHPVVPEASVTNNAGLFSQNVIVLAFEVSNNFLEAVNGAIELRQCIEQEFFSKTYANSLSMLLPKPGVSTMVSAIRTPSSSSSAVYNLVPSPKLRYRFQCSPTLTGLILIPSSTCAVSGLSEFLRGNTPDSHKVLTKVVLPDPEEPESDTKKKSDQATMHDGYRK